MKILSFFNNLFFGIILFFNKLLGLKVLYFSFNKFFGDIFSDYFLGIILRRFWLFDNELFGKILELLGKIVGFMVLYLEGNKFIGFIFEFF